MKRVRAHAKLQKKSRRRIHAIRRGIRKFQVEHFLLDDSAMDVPINGLQALAGQLEPPRDWKRTKSRKTNN